MGKAWDKPLDTQLLLPLDLPFPSCSQLELLLPVGIVALKGDLKVRLEQDGAWMSVCSSLKIAGILMDFLDEVK